MMSTLKPRAPRPKVKHFSGSGLVKQWEELLHLRNPGFSWDGSSRVDSHEMQAVAKVRLYKKPLMKLLAVAETGFPAHLCKGMVSIRSDLFLYFNMAEVTKRTNERPLIKL